MKIFFPAIILLLTGCLCAAPRLAAQVPSSVPQKPAGIFGDWKSTAGSIVRVDTCGAQVCLSLVQLIGAAATTDIHNPDPARRTQPLCGLRIGTGFTLVDRDHATDGTLYDPKNGKTYRGAISAEGRLLHLRGYIGIPLFGESQTWTRPQAPVVPCSIEQN